MMQNFDRFVNFVRTKKTWQPQIDRGSVYAQSWATHQRNGATALIFGIGKPRCSADVLVCATLKETRWSGRMGCEKIEVFGSRPDRKGGPAKL